jgi:hypothetical protein
MLAMLHNFGALAVTTNNNSSDHDASLDDGNNAHGYNMDNSGHDSNTPV